MKLLASLVLVLTLTASCGAALVPPRFQSILFLQSETSACTGFYIYPDKVLTASHCHGKGMRAYHEEGGQSVLTLVRRDEERDLALYDTMVYRQAIPLATAGPGFGDSVWVISRFRPQRDYFVLFRIGVANPATTFGGLTRPMMLLREQMERGQSGSPLINARGQVVSVASRSAFGVAFKDLVAFLK